MTACKSHDDKSHFRCVRFATQSLCTSYTDQTAHQPYTESIAESSASTLRDSTTEESAESLSTKLSEAHSVIKTLREELALVKQQLTDAMDRNIEYGETHTMTS